MIFEYYACFYVSESDFEEMVRLCRDDGYTPQDALNDVACGWDDCDYYTYEYVEDEIIAELEKRLASAK
jgi:hypothetical protein